MTSKSQNYDNEIRSTKNIGHTNGNGTTVSELASPRTELMTAITERPRSKRDMGRIGIFSSVCRHESTMATENINEILSGVYKKGIRGRFGIAFVVEFSRKRRRADDIESITDIEVGQTICKASF